MTSVSLTAQGSGYYRVLVNGVETSKHTAEREASEAAVDAKLADPAATVEYVHDYRVVVDVAGSTAPAPQPMPLAVTDLVASAI